MGKRSKNDFSPNPFKSLKGFRASSSPSTPSREARKSSAPQDAAEPDDFTAFSEEMSRLGLPAPKRETEGPHKEPKKSSKATAPSAEGPKSEKDLFLEALGGMDRIFTDEFPLPEDEPVRAEPRRMKQVKQGRLVPEAQLDLHGLSRLEARARTRFFLENAIHHGFRTVLIVTGRGLGSAGEPVLRAEVERLLAEEGRRWASEWGKAPRRHGGDGAIVVFLRGGRDEGR